MLTTALRLPLSPASFFTVPSDGSPFCYLTGGKLHHLHVLYLNPAEGTVFFIPVYNSIAGLLWGLKMALCNLTRSRRVPAFSASPITAWLKIINGNSISYFVNRCLLCYLLLQVKLLINPSIKHSLNRFLWLLKLTSSCVQFCGDFFVCLFLLIHLLQGVKTFHI